MSRLVALDVTAQARADGCEELVAVSAGVLAQFKDLGAFLQNGAGALARLILAAPPATRLDAATTLVVVNGRAFVLARRQRQTDERAAVVIATPVEVALAGGPGFEVEVMQEVPPTGWFQ